MSLHTQSAGPWGRLRRWRGRRPVHREEVRTADANGGRQASSRPTAGVGTRLPRPSEMSRNGPCARGEADVELHALPDGAIHGQALWWNR